MTCATHTHKLSPLMEITWAVLERARDAGDAETIAACRRLIAANRLGMRRHGRDEDKKLVQSFYAAA